MIGLFDQTPGVIALGIQQARTVALFYFLLAFSHSIAAVCRGAGKAFVPMCIMLSVWCVGENCLHYVSYEFNWRDWAYLLGISYYMGH